MYFDNTKDDLLDKRLLHKNVDPYNLRLAVTSSEQ
jgi:hypothetical protein